MPSIGSALAWALFLRSFAVLAGAIPSPKDVSPNRSHETLPEVDDAITGSLERRQIRGQANKECFQAYDTCVERAAMYATVNTDLYFARVKELHHLKSAFGFFAHLPPCGWLAGQQWDDFNPLRRRDASRSTMTSAPGTSSTPTPTSPTNGTATGNSPTGTNYASVKVEWCAFKDNCIKDLRDRRVDIAAFRVEIESLRASSQQLMQRLASCAYYTTGNYGQTLPEEPLFTAIPEGPGHIIHPRPTQTAPARTGQTASHRLRRQQPDLIRSTILQWVNDCNNELGVLQQEESFYQEELTNAQIQYPNSLVGQAGSQGHYPGKRSTNHQSNAYSGDHFQDFLQLLKRHDHEDEEIKKQANQAWNDFGSCQRDLRAAHQRIKEIFWRLSQMQNKELGVLNSMPHKKRSVDEIGSPPDDGPVPTATALAKRDTAAVLSDHGQNRALAFQRASEAVNFWKGVATGLTHELMNANREFIQRGWNLVTAAKKLKDQVQAKNPFPAMPNGPFASMPNAANSIPNFPNSMPNPFNNMPTPPNNMPNPVNTIPKAANAMPNVANNMPNFPNAFPNQQFNEPPPLAPPAPAAPGGGSGWPQISLNNPFPIPIPTQAPPAPPPPPQNVQPAAIPGTPTQSFVILNTPA